MAKKNNGKNKTPIIITAFVLVVVILITYIALAIWRGTYNPAQWVSKPSTDITKPDDTGNKPSTPDQPDKPNDGNTNNTEDLGGAVVTETESNGIQLLSAVLPRSLYEANDISPLADTAHTLTATLKPAYADNKQVDFSIAWKNPSSAWANGKSISDFLTISQSANNGLTATLTCKKAFAEQAIITVVSHSNDKATATATVDYRKKIISSTYAIENQLSLDGNSGATKTWTWASYDGVNTNSWVEKIGTFTDNFSIGTMNDIVTGHTITVTVSPALKAELGKKFTSSTANTRYNSTLTLECDTAMLNSGKLRYGFTWLSQGALFGYLPITSSTSTHTGIDGLFDFCTNDDDYEDRRVTVSDFQNLVTCLKAVSTDLIITVKTTTQSGGTASTTYNVNVSDSSLEIIVQDVQLNGNVVF